MFMNCFFFEGGVVFVLGEVFRVDIRVFWVWFGRLVFGSICWFVDVSFEVTVIFVVVIYGGR